MNAQICKHLTKEDETTRGSVTVPSIHTNMHAAMLSCMIGCCILMRRVVAKEQIFLQARLCNLIPIPTWIILKDTCEAK